MCLGEDVWSTLLFMQRVHCDLYGKKIKRLNSYTPQQSSKSIALREKNTIFATVKNSYDRHCLASYEFRIVKSSFTMKIKKMIYLFCYKGKRQKM